MRQLEQGIHLCLNEGPQLRFLTVFEVVLGLEYQYIDALQDDLHNLIVFLINVSVALELLDFQGDLLFLLDLLFL